MNRTETWLEAPGAAEWLPVLRAAETTYGIPPDLLCRQCYAESRFDPNAESTAGAVGIMQLEPVYFPHAGERATSDIATAAVYMARLHSEFDDWQLALAAYNWGPGSVRKWQSAKKPFSAMPKETRNYVAQICTDVPVSGTLIVDGGPVITTPKVSAGKVGAVAAGTYLGTLVVGALQYFMSIPVLPTKYADAVIALCVMLAVHFQKDTPSG